MKSLFRGIIVFLLNALTRGILHKYRPQIVMVTGSVGKSSTKDAIATALAPSIYLRASTKSYNSDFGLPLTVIGRETAWGNPIGWLSILVEGLLLLIFPAHYPKLLVLEVGADHPKDLQKLLKIATPDAVVVTRLPEVPVHVEAYEGPEEVREEEFAPAGALAHGAPLILAAEDTHAKKLARGIHATITTYGYGEEADVRITAPVFVADGADAGMHATLSIAGHPYEVSTRGVIGEQQLYAPAAAVATALALGVPVKQALLGLAEYEPPPGRARILAGVSGSLLIDDTYNSSPAAVEEALKSLTLVKGAKRRVAILGDMLELGRYSAKEHERIGVIAAEYVDVLITVGHRAESIATAFLNAREGGTVEDYENSVLAAAAIPESIREGDVVLIKGSQSMRMERITEALLANPEDVAKLPRQDAAWKRR
ncbi:MAG TPA: cyanophycin synthetase [Candidatus Paceibacterota bacterium]|nr:cyanophycin synthetase [Candidatus Paceibacterota bacterium]